MTFKHKLSKRLAISWAVIALACTPGDMPVSPDAPRMDVTAAQVLLQESFEDNAFSGRGWYDNAAMTTTTAQHTAGSTRALEVRFLPGATNPTWGGAARHLFTSSPTLYLSYWVKYSSNWVGSGRLYHPHEFMVMSDQDGDWDGLSNSWLATYIESNYQNGGIPRVQLQDNKAINTSLGLPSNLVGSTENRSVSGCNGVVEANVVTSCFNMPPWYNDKEFSAGGVWFQPNPGAGYKGDWNHVEVYLQMNSVAGGVGVADGVIQYSFNGTPVMDRHDVLFRTGARPNIMFHQFVIAPYIGDGSPVDQSMWVDDVVLATSKPSGAPVDSTPPPPPVTNPGDVIDLAVSSVTNNSATLSFTEVTGGAGLPASYLVRSAVAPIAWGSASEAALGTCKIPLAGTTIGAKRTCTITGLAATTAYQFQLVAFRGTLNVNAVFGGLSNVPANASLVAGTTQQLAATLKDAAGTTLTGRTVTWTSSNAGIATVSSSGLVTAVAAGSATITAASEGKSGTAAMTVAAVTITKPGTVNSLAIASVTTNSVTLAFTEVTNGAGSPASYQVRFAAASLSWGSGTDVSAGTCKAPVVGTTIGAKRTCTITGLAASRAYQFQLVAFRGTLNVNAVFGVLSNVASATTAAATAPAPVATVAVSPTTSGITVGGTQTYAATLKDAAGNTLTGRTVSWTSNNAAMATVSSNGLVTAVVVGSATITATSEGMSGTAGVTVSAAAPPPPPPPPATGGWPNEPAGFTLLTDEPFNALVENGWHQVQRQSTNGSGLFLGSDPTAPLSLSSVLEFKYAVGYTGGSEPGAEYYNPSAPVKEAYFGFWWKPSNPWQNHSGSSVNKLAFIFPSSGSTIYIMMFGGGGGYTMQVEPEFGGDTRRLAPNVTGTPVVLGVWHRVEWYVKYSTNGSSRDGVTQWWLDGVLQGDYRDLQMPGDAGFTEFQFAPTWGGIGDTKAEIDYYWFDHARISKR